MFRNFHNSRGSSIHARKQSWQWRSIFVALVVTLCFGSKGQTSVAQAAPPYVHAYVDVTGPDTICVGKTGTYTGIVYFRPDIPEGGITVDDVRVAGVRVESGSSTKAVADFTRRYQTTRTDAGADDEDVVDLRTGIPPKPYSVNFTLKAKKVGKTTIWFEAVVGGTYASSPMMPVNVVNCKFQVSTISRWNYVTPWGSTKMLAITGRPAIVVLDEKTLRGKANTNLVWVETTNIPHYKETNDLRFGTLDVEGSIGINARLDLNVKHAPVSFTQKICAPIVGCGGGSVTSTPDLVKLYVSADFGGTSITQSNLLTDEGGQSPGQTTVYVIPIAK